MKGWEKLFFFSNSGFSLKKDTSPPFFQFFPVLQFYKISLGNYWILYIYNAF